MTTLFDHLLEVGRGVAVAYRYTFHPDLVPDLVGSEAFAAELQESRPGAVLAWICPRCLRVVFVQRQYVHTVMSINSSDWFVCNGCKRRYYLVLPRR